MWESIITKGPKINYKATFLRPLLYILYREDFLSILPEETILAYENYAVTNKNQLSLYLNKI